MQTTEPEPYECIFCGHKSPAEKHYWADKLDKAELSLPTPDGSSSAGGGFGLKSHPKPKTYYSCSGCSIDYEDISDVGIEGILHGARVKKWVTKTINEFYHGKVDIEYLVRNHRTGIGKRARHGDGFLDKIRSKRKIMIGIKFENRRCFVSLVKKGKKGKQHYRFDSVGRP
jgi:hypothetical protein